MNKLKLFLIFNTFYIGVFSQTITIIDRVNRQPVQDVMILSADKTKSLNSNSKGQADISGFEKYDTILLQHNEYEFLEIKYSDLESINYVVELKPVNILLDEIIVSANRWEENKNENPYHIQKIDMRQASLQNPQTAADLLGTSGFVYIQKSQLAGGSPMLRGFATNRVLLVVDGVRMNNAIFRSGNLQNVISLDAGMTEGTEILFGPGAVMYGSDAIGGVMDFHTLKVKMSENGKFSVNGSAFVRYSSANNENTGHFDFGIKLKKLGFVTGITYSDYDDLMTGSNGNSYYLRPAYVTTINGKDTQMVNSNKKLQKFSGYNQINLMQKILFQPVEKIKLEYGFHYSATSDAPRYDRLCLDSDNNGKLDYAEWYYGPQKWMMNRLEISHFGNNKIYDNLRVISALQNYEESRHDRKFNSKRRRNQTEHVDALSVNIDFDKTFGQQVKLFYGAEFVNNSISSKANRIHIDNGSVTPTNTRYPDGSLWQSAGAYVSMKYFLNENLILNSGIRYSHYFITATFDTTLFPFPFVKADNNNGALNGSLGFVYKPMVNWQFYTNMSTGFRAPNIDDIGKVFESEPGSVVVPNPDLKPEYAWNFEIGTTKIIAEKLKIDLSIYYTYLNNAMARRNFTYEGHDSIMYDGTLSKVQAIQNIANAYVTGVQTEVKYNPGYGFELKSQISYQKGEEKGVDGKYYPKTHIVPTFGSTHLIYQRKNLMADIYSVYNSRFDYNQFSLSERNDNAPYVKDSEGKPYVPSWYTINGKITWFFNKHVSVTAGVENITDRLYRPYGSGISAAGRNFIITLRGNF